MTEDDWESGFGRSIAVYLNGEGIPDRDARGQRVTDDSFYLCFSAHDDAIDFATPGEEYCSQWRVIVDTMVAEEPGHLVGAGEKISVGPRALVVLRKVAAKDGS
jgi:glycogen operon protein